MEAEKHLQLEQHNQDTEGLDEGKFKNTPQLFESKQHTYID